MIPKSKDGAEQNKMASSNKLRKPRNECHHMIMSATT